MSQDQSTPLPTPETGTNNSGSLSEAGSKLKGRGSLVRSASSIIALIIAVFVIYWLFDKVFVYLTARSYVDEIAEAGNLNPYLARALVYLTFIVLVFFGSMTFRLSKRKRLIGILGIIGLLIAHSGVMWWLTSKEIINGKGEALKCYVITRDSVIYRERPGIDPQTGQECRPVTPEIVGRLREYEKGRRPTEITEQNPLFFDRGTGEPIVWYLKRADGEIQLFDLMGFDPGTGKELLPVTDAVVDEWKSQMQRAERKPPQRVDPATYAFFDPVTGKPRVWYARSDDGNWEFYDREGYSPTTGVPLVVVTRELIETWKNYTRDIESQKCYVITQDSVKYSTHPGIDPETGRECRPLTAEMLERLREYEKGKRPQRIDLPNPVFFDQRTGEPIVWYYKNQDGDIELFDLMGFHPETGDELLPVTKDIVDLWKKQIAERKEVKPPRRVDPNKYAFFDPVTGKPRVWYWRNENGDYEFYNNPGFEPRTGDKLLVVSPDAIKAWKSGEEHTQGGEHPAAPDQQKLETDKNAAVLCDQLAANPNDARKSPDVTGVPYDSLQYQATDAIAACTKAIGQSPNELRFQYQLARALEFDNPDKALGIQLQLGKLQYAASYDNAGGIFLRKKDYAAALNEFQMGVGHNDPDAMLSLAEMIKRGLAPGNYLALIQRAASMGHLGAQQELQQEQQRQVEEQNQRAVQMQTQQQALDLLNNILRRVH